VFGRNIVLFFEGPKDSAYRFEDNQTEEAMDSEEMPAYLQLESG
jgi:hypothetical protein